MVTVIHNFPIWLPQTQTWMHTQVQYLPPEVETHVVCERTQNLDQFSVPNIHSLNSEPVWRYHWEMWLRRLRRRRHLGLLVRVARNCRASVLHSHFGTCGWVDMGAARRAGLKHVVTFYGQDVNFITRQEPQWITRYQELFGHIDVVLCEGHHMASCVVDLGAPEQKVHVHHLGIRVEQIPFRPRIWRAGEPLRVLMAASFREKKGICYGLQALATVQHEVPLEITLIGDADSQPRSQAEKQKIVKTIERLKLGSKTRLLGYQTHAVLLEEACKHHIFLSPSVTADDGDTEGGAPVSIIEMAASGMMVVSTSHCDIPEIIRHRSTGFLAEERDIGGLVECFKWLVAHPEAWRPIQESARQHVEADYDARVQGQRLAAIYEGLVRE